MAEKERIKNVLLHRKPTVFRTIIAVLTCIVVSVCFLTNSKEIFATDEAIAAQTAECAAMQDFLNEIFTLNKNGRFEAFEQSLDMEEYYKNLAVLTTGECLKDLTNSRIPFKYDKTLSAEYTSVDVADIQLECYADTTYNFVTRIAFHTDTDVLEKEISGQITVDENLKISNFYVKDTKEFIEALSGYAEQTLSVQREKASIESFPKYFSGEFSNGSNCLNMAATVVKPDWNEELYQADAALTLGTEEEICGEQALASAEVIAASLQAAIDNGELQFSKDMKAISMTLEYRVVGEIDNMHLLPVWNVKFDTNAYYNERKKAGKNGSLNEEEPLSMSVLCINALDGSIAFAE